MSSSSVINNNSIGRSVNGSGKRNAASSEIVRSHTTSTIEMTIDYIQILQKELAELTSRLERRHVAKLFHFKGQ